MNNLMHIFRISRQQNTDFSLVLVLVCCFLAYYTNKPIFSVGAIILCLFALVIPNVFTPFTWIWFKLADILGRITSTLLLSVIFFCVVTPVACIRKLCKKDSLRLNAFKQGEQSVFIDRNHLFQKEDLTNTF